MWMGGALCLWVLILNRSSHCCGCVCVCVCACVCVHACGYGCACMHAGMGVHVPMHLTL